MSTFFKTLRRKSVYQEKKGSDGEAAAIEKRVSRIIDDKDRKKHDEAVFEEEIRQLVTRLQSLEKQRAGLELMIASFTKQNDTKSLAGAKKQLEDVEAETAKLEALKAKITTFLTRQIEQPTQVAVRTVKAKFDFDAEDDSQLSIKPGDEIILLEDTDEDWWLGRLNDKMGYFPKVYVDAVSSRAENHSPSNSSEYQKNPLALRNSDSSSSSTTSVTPNPTPTTTLTPTPSPTPNATQNAAPNATPNAVPTANKTGKKMAKALFDYKARSETELSIKQGDVIACHITDADEWWEGELNGRVGFFPKLFVEEIEDEVVEEKSPAAPASLSDPSISATKVRALFDYDANTETELSIKPGDVITLIAMDDDEWWEGELGGKIGFFPKLYVEIIKENKSTALSRTSSISQPSATPSPLEKSPSTSSESSSKEGPSSDSQDLPAVVQTKSGSFIELTKSPSAAEPTAETQQSGAPSETKPAPSEANSAPTPTRCKALFDYQASQESELSILPGDIITLVATDDDEWWEGELNGNIGYFPKAYVEIIALTPRSAMSTRIVASTSAVEEFKKSEESMKESATSGAVDDKSAETSSIKRSPSVSDKDVAKPEEATKTTDQEVKKEETAPKKVEVQDKTNGVPAKKDTKEKEKSPSPTPSPQAKTEEVKMPEPRVSPARSPTPEPQTQKEPAPNNTAPSAATATTSEAPAGPNVSNSTASPAKEKAPIRPAPVRRTAEKAVIKPPPTKAAASSAAVKPAIGSRANTLRTLPKTPSYPPPPNSRLSVSLAGILATSKTASFSLEQFVKDDWKSARGVLEKLENVAVSNEEISAEVQRLKKELLEVEKNQVKSMEVILNSRNIEEQRAKRIEDELKIVKARQERDRADYMKRLISKLQADVKEVEEQSDLVDKIILKVVDPNTNEIKKDMVDRTQLTIYYINKSVVKALREANDLRAASKELNDFRIQTEILSLEQKANDRKKHLDQVSLKLKKQLQAPKK
eukprot:TRINITY_DN2452_c0_g1_i2.p1 TRINITY_DN2452_c0_g1~~TRINITY_DN2452_c0_g1_i2.p1  ORF type:complete len:990 (-),score=297.38 TRINITY_DN2452_c0_g1_i2:109-3078(-)